MSRDVCSMEYERRIVVLLILFIIVSIVLRILFVEALMKVDTLVSSVYKTAVLSVNYNSVPQP